MRDIEEIEKVSRLFGIRKISGDDDEYCGTLGSANCPVDDYGYDVLFLSVEKKKDFVTLHISSIDDSFMSASSSKMSNDKYLDIYYDNLIDELEPLKKLDWEIILEISEKFELTWFEL